MRAGKNIREWCEQGPVNLRDLMDFKSTASTLAIEDVESITSIRKRLVSPGISLGALSPEAHETLSVAMNRIGAKSDSARVVRIRPASVCVKMVTMLPARSSRLRRGVLVSLPNI